MSGFGGFNPMPLRLGGSATDGWATTQHSRLCADLVAASRTAVLARISYKVSGDPAQPVVIDYRGANGVGPAFAPALTQIGTGLMLIEFPAAMVDEYGNSVAICIRHGKASCLSSATPYVQTVVVEDTNSILVCTFNLAGSAVDVTTDVSVHGWLRDASIGDYDGATDKQDTSTEQIPYAWSAYQEYTGALGSAFTTSTSGMVHARKLALSRMEAAVQRGAEKINANSHPNTADDMLGEWVKMLHLRLRGTETRQQIRQLSAARFASTSGNSPASVDAACQALLGSAFVSCIRTTGVDLDTPPVPTYWPGVNPGSSAYDLGGGTWMSPRSHLTVNINPPADVNDADFSRLINVDLYGLLSDLLPAWATFNAAEASGDFLLDIDLLDVHALT